MTREKKLLNRFDNDTPSVTSTAATTAIARQTRTETYWKVRSRVSWLQAVISKLHCRMTLGQVVGHEPTLQVKTRNTRTSYFNANR